MKTRTAYGTYHITSRVAAQVQLEWDMVEQPTSSPSRPRFLDFPLRDRETPPPPQPPRTEKRPLAA